MDHSSNPPRADPAARAWEAMRTLVLDRNDRRKAVSDALGMGFVRVKALHVIAQRPRTMRDLAEFLIIDRPYTTVIVDDLERRGFVERTTDPEDRRCKIVAATPAGQDAARTVSEIFGVVPESFSRLDPAEITALERILGKLLA